MKQVLIVKTSAIGDVLHTLSVIDYLKGRFPRCQIDWVVEKPSASLLKSHPGLDRVLVVDTKLWRRSPFRHRKAISSFIQEMRGKTYDVLFDLQGNAKSGLITAFASARRKVGYGWNTLPERLNYIATNVHLPACTEGNIRTRNLRLLLDYFGDDEPSISSRLSLLLTQREENRLQSLKGLSFGGGPKVMVCFGSKWRNKQLSEPVLLAFLKRVAAEVSPSFFFIYGNEKEKELAEKLELEFSGSGHAVGEMSLPLWQQLMEAMDLVLTVDSAALHLCGTTSTPSFSVFGPSSPHVYKPFGDEHTAFQGSCPYGQRFDQRCPRLRTCETGACIQNLSADLLFNEFSKFWKRISQLTPV
ncbi:MAG: Lipopolysaccharide heptosyltransferase 1 [Chlamydiae bacterium]|nr:Lipopolysaccharide heptosyltransferase 1 [Chlamydiota bacterium]